MMMKIFLLFAFFAILSVQVASEQPWTEIEKSTFTSHAAKFAASLKYNSYLSSTEVKEAYRNVKSSKFRFYFCFNTFSLQDLNPLAYKIRAEVTLIDNSCHIDVYEVKDEIGRTFSLQSAVTDIEAKCSPNNLRR
jgi:hypothetical protein